MNPTMTQQLDQLYPYQALQRQHSVRHVQPRRQDSLQVPLSSPSSIGHPPPNSPVHPLPPSTPTSGVIPVAHHQYSQDLVRQQKEQMQQLIQQHKQEQEVEQLYREAEYEMERRKSEEQLYLMNMAAAEEYRVNVNVNVTGSPSPQYDGDLRAEDLAQLEFPMDGQVYQGHPAQMVAYPQGPLDLQGEAQAGMIKFESP